MTDWKFQENNWIIKVRDMCKKLFKNWVEKEMNIIKAKCQGKQIQGILHRRNRWLELDSSCLSFDWGSKKIDIRYKVNVW